MCLIRLLKLLKLDKITQISFAEYYSKMNFVKRVHAEENRMLSKHGKFKSNSIHKADEVDSAEHSENMEGMLDKVRICIQSGTFGGKQLLRFRGVKPSQWIFDDEPQLRDF